MMGTLLAFLVALLGLALAVRIGRQERSAWTPALLGGVVAIAGVGALQLLGQGDIGLVSTLGALLMYGALVAAAAIIAGKGRG